MSLTDPDARARTAATFLRPAAWVLALLGLASGPVLFAIAQSSGHPSSTFGPFFGIYLGSSVIFGTLLYYVAAHRNPIGIAAFIVAYLGGLFLVLGTTDNKASDLPKTETIAAVIYGIAAILFIVYIAHAVSAHRTLADGVTTTATVTGAGVDGMVNYVPLWKLTLKFTDGQGKDRWFHIRRTGMGYSVGDTFQIKYNANNPGSTRSIVVMDG